MLYNGPVHNGESAMPDITMCEGKDCPHKDICWRAQAEPSPYRQSYFIEAPVRNGECQYFWHLEDAA